MASKTKQRDHSTLGHLKQQPDEALDEGFMLKALRGVCSLLKLKYDEVAAGLVAPGAEAKEVRARSVATISSYRIDGIIRSRLAGSDSVLRLTSVDSSTSNSS